MEKYNEEDEELVIEESTVEDEATIRRQERRRRRVRNQIISYSTIALLLIAVGIGIFIGIRAIVNDFGVRKEAKIAETQAEEQAKEEASEIVIEAPDSVDTEAESLDTDQEEIYEEVDYLGEAVDTTISSMTLEDKVAQLFITTPEALTGVNAATQAGEGTQSALNTYAVGGLVYSSKNIVDSEQLTNLISTTSGMSKYELFLGINEPGGDGDAIGSSSLESIPAVDSPETIGESGDSANAYNAGATIASYLALYGFNLDFAPNGTIITDEASIAKGESYGADETTVQDMNVQMIEGLKSGNVLACMTGFPGLGGITSKTTEGVVESEMTEEELTVQLTPYISGIATGASMVQLNNVTYVTADDTPVPASLSRYVINTLLRNNMGYDGIVLTGSINENAVTEKYSSADAVKLAIVAGADMIYCPENFEEAYNALLEAVKDGTIAESRLDESLKRIYRVKLADDIE